MWFLSASASLGALALGEAGFHVNTPVDTARLARLHTTNPVQQPQLSSQPRASINCQPSRPSWTSRSQITLDIHSPSL